MADLVFISYRRDDVAGHAGRLHGDLTRHFGQDRVFIDLKAIKGGEPFPEAILQAIGRSKVVLVVIGRGWVSIVDQAGRQRLAQADDWVRQEVAKALELGLKVIPILVARASFPPRDLLPESLVRLAELNAVELSETRWDDDVRSLVDLFSELVGPPEGARNPFTLRARLSDPDLFCGRRVERQTLGDYLAAGSNCQVVGPPRIGKSSLLWQVGPLLDGRPGSRVKVGHLDATAPQNATLSGWLGQAARRFGWARTPATLPEFEDEVLDMIARGVRPVLCLDKFAAFAGLEAEFRPDFFRTLRYLGEQGMSIATAASRPLSELIEASDETSPFYNTFPILRLGRLAEADVRDFVTRLRPAVAAFTPPERDAIIGFARGHPLAMQVGCYHVLTARSGREQLGVALARADEEMDSLARSWRTV